MSMCEWVVEGIGICTDKIEPFIDKEKLAYKLFEQLPEDNELAALIEAKSFNKLDVDNYMFGCPFENMADVLCHFDDTDTLSYSSDGEGAYYFYYPPSMPWHRKETEPESAEEVHRRIIKAVKKITDLSDDEIDNMIDDELFVIGFG